MGRPSTFAGLPPPRGQGAGQPRRLRRRTARTLHRRGRDVERVLAARTRPDDTPARLGPEVVETFVTFEDKLERVTAGRAVAVLPAHDRRRTLRDDVAAVPVAGITATWAVVVTRARRTATRSSPTSRIPRSTFSSPTGERRRTPCGARFFTAGDVTWPAGPTGSGSSGPHAR